MTDQNPALVWFRNDLRVADNPALHAAAADGRPVLALYILEEAEGVRPLGGAERWWLHHSLAALSKSLSLLGSPLVLRRGDSAKIVRTLVEEIAAGTVYWNRRYDSAAIERDAALKRHLEREHTIVKSSNSSLLHEPWQVRTKSDTPFHVFTPFWRTACSLDVASAVPAPDTLASVDAKSDDLDSWCLRPSKPDWAGGFRDTWTPGEDGAHERLRHFLEGPDRDYARQRDLPDRAGTSGLSPHLRWGEISPRQIWRAKPHSDVFLKELGWREFAYHLLYAHPELPHRPLRGEFERFPWRRNPALLRAWQQGRTGYPIVDAGMRQLWHTGWMHNRVRMVVASFLTKHLLQPWQDGAAWFLDTLVDADLASNSANWQWVAGCGADAAPYFRIFNPILQGLKFDPEGAYVRRWVPELKYRDQRRVHEPRGHDEEGLGDYPKPIVDHATARQLAMAAFDELKGT